MDWANEQYILVYIRDTGDWLLWTWQTRAVLLFIFRKVDRAGVLHLGKGKLRALAKLIEMPEDDLLPALEPLLEDGCVQLRGDKLVVPNFIKAQETSHSDRVRKQMSRERARDIALSQSVTTGHAESQSVTLASKASNTTLASESDARAEDRASEPRLKSVSPPKLEPSEAATPPPREPEGRVSPTRPTGVAASGDSESGYDLARRLWSEAWQAKYRRPYDYSPHTGPRSEDYVLQRVAASALTKVNPGEAEAYLRHKFAAYLRDHGTRGYLDEQSHPLRCLERDWAKYGEPKEPRRMVPRRDEEPVELVSVEEMMRRAEAAMTAGIGKPEAKAAGSGGSK